MKPFELVEKIASSQAEILRKLVLHFLTDQLEQLSLKMNEKQLKEEIYQLFQPA